MILVECAYRNSKDFLLRKLAAAERNSIADVVFAVNFSMPSNRSVYEVTCAASENSAV